MSERRIGIIGAIWVLSLILTASVAYSFSGPSQTMYISGGMYPGAVTYTIWGEDSNYYSKNAYGEIYSGGTNLSSTVQYALNIGGRIAFANGTYIFANPLTASKDGTEILGSGNTIFVWPVDGTLLTITGLRVTLSHLTIVGANNNGIIQSAIKIANTSGYCELSHLDIHYFQTYPTISYALQINVGDNVVDHCHLWSNLYAIYIGNPPSYAGCTLNKIINSYIYCNVAGFDTIGIYIDGGAAGTRIVNNHFENFQTRIYSTSNQFWVIYNTFENDAGINDLNMTGCTNFFVCFNLFTKAVNNATLYMPYTFIHNQGYGTP